MERKIFNQTIIDELSLKDMHESMILSFFQILIKSQAWLLKSFLDVCKGSSGMLLHSEVLYPILNIEFGVFNMLNLYPQH